MGDNQPKPLGNKVATLPPLVIQVTIRHLQFSQERPHIRVGPVYDWIDPLELGPARICHVAMRKRG